MSEKQSISDFDVCCGCIVVTLGLLVAPWVIFGFLTYASWVLKKLVG